MTAPVGHNQKQYRSPNSLSDQERKELRGVLQELNDSMTRVAAEKELQKEAVNTICDKLDFNPKILKKMAKVYYKANFNQEAADQQEFEDFYNLVVNNKGE